MRHQRSKGCLHSPHGRIPPAATLLSEKPRRRIPRTVGAFVQPAPIIALGDQDPDRFRQRPGEMSNRSIHRDYEVKGAYDGGGLRKVCELRGKISDAI